MSRVVTPPLAQSVRIPHEKIAMRAYQKWLRRGQPHGTDVQDWMEAEAELKAEMSHGCTSSHHHHHTSSHHHQTGSWR
jgi:hypothetical protein